MTRHTPSPTANAQDVTATESSVDKILRLMFRKRRRDEAKDNGTWLGLGDIKQMVGGEREAVRGDLIALVARGDVEVCEFSNGVAWRSAKGLPVVDRNKGFEPDGHYALQREVNEDGRSFWFDAETFDNSKRAADALRWAKSADEARIRADGGSGYTMRRSQKMRIVQVQS